MATPLRIAFRDTYRLPGTRAGLGYYSIQLALALGPRFDIFDVFTSEPVAYPGLRTIQDNTLFQTQGLRRALKFLRRSFFPQTLRGDYDIVLYPHPFEPLVFHPKAKHIMVLHDLIPLIFWPRRLRDIYPHVFFRRVLPRTLRRVDRIVAVSETTKRDVVRLFGLREDQIRVIYQGIDPKLPRLAKEHRAAIQPSENKPPYPYLLYIGNFEAHKNVRRLLEAFAAIVQNRNLHLICIGPTNSRKIRRTVNRLGLGDRVTILNAVSDQSLARIIADAEALVQPSLYEGFGRPPLEAMSIGLPIACSKAASLPEVCGSAAVYFDPYDIGEMAAALREVVFNAETRARSINDGLKRSESFRWEFSADAFLTLMNEIRPSGA